MLIKEIKLTNFRSYSSKIFEVKDNPELITGPNGTGKTNILEAIYLACTGKSFRLSSKDSNLIQAGKDWARLDLSIDFGSKTKHRTVKLNLRGPSALKSLEISSSKKLFSKNLLPVILFEPSQLSLLSAAPERRRAFLDVSLSLVSHDYQQDLNKYRKALLQRNRLLKLIASGKASIEDLFIWNVKLSELGSKITLARKDYLARLDADLESYYHKISKKDESLSASYLSKLDLSVSSTALAAEMFNKLEQAAPQDILIGFTRHGPHKDDWQISLRGQDAATSASRGEIRSIILSLKLFEFHDLEKAFETEPVVLLDDVMSELDAARRKKLLSFFAPAQVIVTSVD